MLEKINRVEDVKKLNEKDKIELAEEIREYILKTVSENGGHLASNLGVVELTIALHSIFDVPQDKIIWDVGHQSYVHKILNTEGNLRAYEYQPCPDCFLTSKSYTQLH